jgi:hypothetical protein
MISNFYYTVIMNNGIIIKSDEKFTRKKANAMAQQELSMADQAGKVIVYKKDKTDVLVFDAYNMVRHVGKLVREQ